MRQPLPTGTVFIICIVCGLLALTALFAGCTGTSQQPAATTAVTPSPATTAAPASPAATTPAPAAATKTPAPVFTASTGNVVAFTAASLKGVSANLSADFEKAYPGEHVVFNLDGTQALKTQVQNGAYADVFISASNSYTNELNKGGYFVNGSVKPLTTNYVIVILPAGNPANITSLDDLARPGIKIAMGDKSVPVGTATYTSLANLANSTFSSDWNASVFKNVVTFETAEPGVATKVQLGEVDAGFVYESTAVAAKPGTFTTITIPKKDNYLQTYTIGILNQSVNQGPASDFVTFMLSGAGQQDLKDFGFRPASSS